MQLGLVSVSFRSHSVSEILSACAENGISFIEWGSDVHAPAHSLPSLRSVAAESSALGISCCSYGTYFRLGVDKPSQISQYFSAAELLGTSTLRIWCGSKASFKHSPEERSALLRDTEAVARLAESAGMTLATEFHNNTFTDTKEATLALISAAGSDNFRTYWQPNQYVTAEENLASARALAPFTKNIHVFNWSGDCKFPLSEASELWHSYLSNFSGEHYALLEFMPDGKLSTLSREALSLRNILK